MAKDTISKIRIKEDLRIENIAHIHNGILGKLKKNKDFSIDLTDVRTIDLSGLQLLISLFKTVSQSENKIVSIKGLSEDLRTELQGVLNSNRHIKNEDELLRFLKEQL